MESRLRTLQYSLFCYNLNHSIKLTVSNILKKINYWFIGDVMNKLSLNNVRSIRWKHEFFNSTLFNSTVTFERWDQLLNSVKRVNIFLLFSKDIFSFVGPMVRLRNTWKLEDQKLMWFVRSIFWKKLTIKIAKVSQNILWAPFEIFSRFENPWKGS